MSKTEHLSTIRIIKTTSTRIGVLISYLFGLCFLFCTFSYAALTKQSPLSPPSAPSLVKTQQGLLSGLVDKENKLHVFKGVPFASAPIGNARWQAPKPPKAWKGVKQATHFAHQCMQLPLYSDMTFRSSGMSEDCLYLNVWTPALKPEKALPVLLYFYGGGFAAGDGSEPRYDGASMATKDIVVITANYRLGLFGLFSHPELSAETEYKGSGNYTFMDQAQALQWVVDNVSAFGGDPTRITIGGESAGSLSVSALMASPLSKHNVAGAIGQSGSLLGRTLSTVELSEGEQNGARLAMALAQQKSVENKAAAEKDTKALSIAELRAMPANELLQRATKAQFQWFLPTIDGLVFPKPPSSLYVDGEFSKVPLLVGNNSQEGSFEQIFGNQEITSSSLVSAIKRLYPDNYEAVSELYSGSSTAELMDAAQALASDRFISFSTWNWADRVAKHTPEQVYFYEYSRIRPLPVSESKDAINPNRGAVHSAEIEYALGNLDAHPAYHWESDDYLVSEQMQNYFANFIKTGNPNGAGLIAWPLFAEGKQLNINVQPRPQSITHLRERYNFHRWYNQ